MATSTPILKTNVTLASTVAANRFVGFDGNYSIATAVCKAGVSTVSGVAGDVIAVISLGTALVEAGTAINKDGEVEVHTDGTARSGNGNYVVGYAMNTAAIGELVEVMLRDRGRD